MKVYNGVAPLKVTSNSMTPESGSEQLISLVITVTDGVSEMAGKLIFNVTEEVQKLRSSICAEVIDGYN